MLSVTLESYCSAAKPSDEEKQMSAAVLTQVVELKPGGKDIPVTTANRIAYIHLVADYRLNKQIRPHCLAFRQGLANVVNLEWLRMFDQQELQVRCTAHATARHLYRTRTSTHTFLSFNRC